MTTHISFINYSTTTGLEYISEDFVELLLISILSTLFFSLINGRVAKNYFQYRVVVLKANTLFLAFAFFFDSKLSFTKRSFNILLTAYVKYCIKI